MAPLTTLLTSIVDYAGLFPPAGLDMTAAVGAYGECRRAPHAWMLGAFVVPAGRISELAGVLREPGASSWPVSVLVPSLDNIPKIYERGIQIRALEVAPRDARAIVEGRGGAPEGMQVFYEVPLDARMEARLDAVAEVGGAAKVRTGGVTPEAFPEASRLIAFVRACVERSLAFKATAGLHHPRGGCYALTYEPTSVSANMYGFVDLALVTALLQSRRVDTGEAAALLAGHPSAVEPVADELRWHGYRFSIADLARLRETLFLSFGSCSFDEPVVDLQRMGLL